MPADSPRSQPAFKLIGGLTGHAAQLQENVKRILEALLPIPFLWGTWVRNVSVTTGGITLTHGLGRVPQGYVLTKMIGYTSSLMATGASVNTLSLKCSPSNCIVDVWIF